MQEALKSPENLGTPSPRWTKDQKRHLTEEETLVNNRHVKRCSNSSVIREIQMKITVSYHWHPSNRQKLGSWKMPSGGRDMGIVGFLLLEACRQVRPFQRAVHHRIKCMYALWPSNATAGRFPRGVLPQSYGAMHEDAGWRCLLQRVSFGGGGWVHVEEALSDTLCQSWKE